MEVTVRFFAQYADRLGVDRTTFDLHSGSRVRDVLASIATLPGADSLPRNPLVAVNHVFAGPDTVLDGGDEIAVIPPVAGG